MNKFESIGDRRRKSPAHYWAKADNSRYTAYCLSQVDIEKDKKLANDIGYNGSTEIAVRESFRREAAISIELVIKAVIAQRNENDRNVGKKNVCNVPMSHDVVKLWQQAKLPKLSDEYQYRLVRIKSLLMWSGRYGAPRKDEVYAEERSEIRPYENVVTEFKGLRVTRGRRFEFKHFDYLYNIAITEYEKLQPKLDTDTTTFCG